MNYALRAQRRRFAIYVDDLLYRETYDTEHADYLIRLYTADGVKQLDTLVLTDNQPSPERYSLRNEP